MFVTETHPQIALATYLGLCIASDEIKPHRAASYLTNSYLMRPRSGCMRGIHPNWWILLTKWQWCGKRFHNIKLSCSFFESCESQLAACESKCTGKDFIYAELILGLRPRISPDMYQLRRDTLQASNSPTLTTNRIPCTNYRSNAIIAETTQKEINDTLKITQASYNFGWYWNLMTVFLCILGVCMQKQSTGW